ncbi:MAG: aminotransferase class I/II-fold pyridoxal phosphate-dependent enzyme [Syntrophomonas sp.]
MQENSRIYLSPPHMSGYELEYIKEAFDSNWIAPLGPHVTAFEKEICQYTRAGGAVAVSSGTAAIHLALRLLGISSGDTVFCSSFTFIGSVNPILYQGATPVFIDSEPESWNMSPPALKNAFNEAACKGRMPKAVITVNLYGQSANMKEILAICNEYDVPVIEDAAESIGATYKNKASGTWGKFGIYSFNGNKIITTSGGGMLVSNDIQSIEKALFWATQARDPAPYYQHSEMGYNYRMSNIVAAIGRGQLRVLDSRVRARRAVFQRYYDELSDIDGIGFMPEAPYGMCNRWLTVITLDPDIICIKPAELIAALESQNIEARHVWKPMHLQPLFKDCDYYPHESNSISEHLFMTGVCLPSGSILTDVDHRRVVSCIKSCLVKTRKGRA